MRKTLLLLFLAFFVCVSIVNANVYNNQISFGDVVSKLPDFLDVSCKYTQDKYIQSSGLTLSSGGNFYFKKSEGIFFETLYPIRSVKSYNNNSNRQISRIVEAISNKNYSFIDKNFKVYFENKANIWTFVLAPKNNTSAFEVLDYIKVSGNYAVDNIVIKSLNGDRTELKFVCPRG